MAQTLNPQADGMFARHSKTAVVLIFGVVALVMLYFGFLYVMAEQ